MFITSIGRKFKFKIQNSKFKISGLILVFLFLLFGCSPQSVSGEYLQKAESNYLKALKAHESLIAKGKGPDRLHLQLGRLHYRYGEFQKAADELKKTGLKDARRLLAIAYYRNGNFTDALEVFNKNEIDDGEYLYYKGLTCEKLNLFDKALEIYARIKSGKFSALASQRINAIEKEAHLGDIKDIDLKTAEIISRAPAQEDYPQAGALVLSCDEKIEITPQNTQIAHLHYIIKILNERGKKDFAETQIGYDSTYEKVELEYARTIRPDGKVVEVGSRHIRDVSKYLNYPLYSNARVYIISFPEIAKDCVIEYKVKVYRNQLINKKDFAFRYPLQSGEPILHAGFALVIPENRKIFIKNLNEQYNNFSAQLKPQVKKEKKNLIYSWDFGDIPQIIPESNMPPAIEINPAMLISSFASWEDIYKWWWGLAKDKIKADSAIKEKVRELIQGMDSVEAKARAIYNFCAKEIRYVAVGYGDAGYEPHKAEDIFRNKYGDCKDQSVLLATMFKEAGLSAQLVLIPTKDCYNLDPEFPSMIFNHVISAVELDNKIVFLDPTAQTCPLGDLPAADQGRSVLLVKEGGYEIKNIPFYPPEHNLNRQSVKIKVNKDETITAQRFIFTNGLYQQAQRYWLLHTAPELIEEAIKEKIQDISIGAQLKEYKVKNLDDLDSPVELEYSFRGPEYFTIAGDLRIMPQLAYLDASLVAKDERKYPLDFGILDSKETSLEVALPGNFRLKYMPKDISEDNRWFKFSAEYRHGPGAIFFRQIIQIKEVKVTQQEYPAFKALFEDLAKRIKQRIILEKKK